MFERLGRFVVHNPWKVIAGWVLITIAIVAFAPALGDQVSRDQANFLPSDYESVQATELGQEAFGQTNNGSATVVVKRTDGKPLADPDTAAIAALTAKLATKGTVDHAIGAAPGQGSPSPDGKVATIEVGFDQPADDPELLDSVKQVRSVVDESLPGDALTHAVGGQVAQLLDNQDAFDSALVIVGAATVLLIIGLLLVIYRSPVAALLPIVTVGLVSAIAPGLVAWLAQLFDFQVDQSVQIVMTIVLYGVGTDYIVFLLFRYRERLRAGDDKKTALIAAVARVGEVIMSAAAAIIIAFMALLLAVFGAFTSFGPSLSIAVALMALAAVTLIPAVVSLIGTVVFWPSKSWQRTPKGTTFQKLGRLTGRRPGAVAVVSVGVMGVLALGMLGFNTSYDSLSQLPSDTESARADNYTKESLPAGTSAPTFVFVEAEHGAALDQAALDAYGAKLGKADGIDGAAPIPDPADLKNPAKAHFAFISPKNPSVAQIVLFLDANPFANESLDVAGGTLRDVADAEAPPGTQAHVGGLSSVLADIRDANNRDLWVIFPVAGVLIALVLGLMLRSIVAPLYLMAAVVLGFFSTMGATVLAFQGIGGQTGLSFMLPMMLYLFVVAIGTDYNILMIARLREEAKLGNDSRTAADLAIEHGGPSVGAAGLILAGTFASLMLAGVSFLTEMGFAVSLGILIAAFVMSLFLVPSVTALLGHKAWWPGHGDEPDALPAASERDPAPIGS